MPFTVKELTWLGVGKETAFGTAVTPTYYVPFKDVKPVDVIDYIKDQGIRGAMAQTYNVLAGPMHSTLDVSGETFPDNIGLFLLGILGKDTVTGTSPYTHSFALARTAQPPSLTASYYDGTTERQFAGQILEEFTLKWADKSALEFSAKSQGVPSTTTTTGTPTPTTTIPFVNWGFTATLGGSAKLNLVGFDISIKRKLYVQHAANNTQAPTAIVAGPVEVTGKATFDKMDDSELTAYLTNTQPAFVLTGTQAGTNYGITIQMSKCAFLKDAVTGKEVVQGDVDFEGIDNTTDNGPCLIKLINAVATY
jgi:hypothetical protein